jgi:hypothetical protein
MIFIGNQRTMQELHEIPQLQLQKAGCRKKE